MLRLTGYQFEDEVRNIARNLFSNGIGQGSKTVDGRERDGVFWNGDFYTVVEATTDKKKDKAEKDGKKTHDLVTKLRKEGHMAKGLLVTLHEPTPDQKEIIERKYKRTTEIISFDEFRSKLFDALSYINNREKKRFGSVYDHVDGNFEIPLSDFVEPTISMLNSSGQVSGQVSFDAISIDLRQGKRRILIAEYGVGKSMVLRQLFHDIAKRFREKKYFRIPIAINLRDHLGQTDPVELLERHARANAANPQNLVAAWNAGYVDLLIDGFDELSTRGWTGDVKRLREYRRTSHSVIRKLIKETPQKCGVVIVGRDAYFDSLSEMRDSLGASESIFEICRIHPFNEKQAAAFLRKKHFSGSLPEWMPTRPLLLTYLVRKGLLQAAVSADAGGDFPRGSAWLSLLDMISERESEQLDGVDKHALIEFFGALASQSRQSADGFASFSPQKMEEVFSSVTGNTIVEDERNLLLRLPGLGAAQDNALHRSFIDSDFMNICCGVPTLRYIEHPYADYSQTYGFDGLAAPLNDVGIEAVATLVKRKKIECGVVNASIDRALKTKAMQLSFDVFRVAQQVCEADGSFTFEHIYVDEIDLTSGDYDGWRADFSECLVNRVILPTPDQTNQDITFTECLIGGIEGRVSKTDLDTNQFISCDVDQFTDEYAVNSQVLDTSLALGVRVLVVTLRKLFTQYGSSRLESALYRGLDQRSRMIVPSVIELLCKHSFIVNTGRQGKTTYAGTKMKREEALNIIQSPNSSNSIVVKECEKLG